MTGREVDIYWDFALLPSGEKIWTPVKTRKQAWLDKYIVPRKTPEELLAGTQAKGKKKQIPPQKPSTSSKINTYKFPTTNATPDFSGTTFPNLQTREKRPRTKSAPIVDIPDDQGGPKSRNIFVPKWETHGSIMLWISRWQVADEKRLKEVIQKIFHLSEQFNNARKEVEEEKKGRDAADAEVSWLKGIENDLLGQIEWNLSSHEAMKKQYEIELEEVEVSHYSIGYNYVVCQAKEMGMDYKALLIDPRMTLLSSTQMMPRLLPWDEDLILGSLPDLK